jgi:hypothetical protein
MDGSFSHENSILDSILSRASGSIANDAEPAIAPLLPATPKPKALPPTSRAQIAGAKANAIPKPAKPDQWQSHSGAVAHDLGAAALAPLPSQCRALGTECHQIPAEA